MKKIFKKFSFKVGDNVKIISGNDKGKIGKILAILKKKNSLLVEGINRRIKHVPSKKKEKKSGMIKEINCPIHISNIMFWSQVNNTVSRIGYKYVDNQKVRYLKKTNEIIDRK